MCIISAKAAADADKVAGISKVDAETTIARTEQEKIAEIKEAEAKAKEAELNATVIVPANKAKEKAIIDAEASAEMYEHIHLGQVTVYGNENTAGSFMAKTAENLNPAFELLKSIPFKKTFKEMFVEDKKDNPTEDNFEAVK